MALKLIPRLRSGQATHKRLGRIGVLMGGTSTEREISLKSGKAVYNCLRQAGADVTAIDITTDDKEENIRLIKSQEINCAFLALHGSFGEDGRIQRFLETIDLPYTGSGVKASRSAMDKIASRRIFEKSGLRVPRYKAVNKSSSIKSCKFNSLNLPLVVKPSRHGSSVGLSVVRKAGDFNRALALAFSYDKDIIIEQYISGKEVTVGILDNRALPVIEIRPKRGFFDYRAKYHKGMTDYIVPAKLDKKARKAAQQAAVAAHKLLGCFGCSRVDIILDENNLPVILEVNTIPGFTETSLLPKAAKCAGIEFDELCLTLIKLAYEKAKA